MRIVPPLINNWVLSLTLIFLSFVLALFPMEITADTYEAYTYCSTLKDDYILRDKALMKEGRISVKTISAGVFKITSLDTTCSLYAERALQKYIDEAKKWRSTLVFDEVRTAFNRGKVLISDYPMKLIGYLFSSVVICMAWDNRRRMFFEEDYEG